MGGGGVRVIGSRRRETMIRGGGWGDGVMKLESYCNIKLLLETIK
jgi:hypothetical protein